MYRFYLAAIDILPAALLFAPAYLILNKAYCHNSRKSFLYFLFSCYLSAVYVLVGMPNITYIRPELNLNLIPIIGMIDDWKNSILNILLFVPLAERECADGPEVAGGSRLRTDLPCRQCHRARHRRTERLSIGRKAAFGSGPRHGKPAQRPERLGVII